MPEEILTQFLDIVDEEWPGWSMERHETAFTAAGDVMATEAAMAFYASTPEVTA